MILTAGKSGHSVDAIPWSYVILTLAFFCCTLFATGCGPSEEHTQSVTRQTPVTVGCSSLAATQAVVIYAFEKGIYAEYGLNVSLVFSESGSKAAFSLISGEIDFCQIAGSAVVNSVVADAGLVLIAGLFNTYVYSLMVVPEIETSSDLRGKTLAVSSFGSSSDTAIRSAIKSLGLEPDVDTAVLAIGRQSQRLAAMQAGRVAGTVISVPQTIIAKELGYRELVNMLELKIPYQHTAIATSRKFLEKNPDTSTRFLQATIDAIARMKKDKDGFVRVVAKYLLLDEKKDKAALEESYHVLIQGYLPDMPYPTVEGVQILLDQASVTNPSASKYTPSDVIDTTLLSRIEKSGFKDRLKQ